VLHRNSERLVNELETLPLLEGRFRDIRLVNFPNGEKRGFFSLVFMAYDTVEDKHVALKFFDQDPSKMTPHRLACFEREHELLGDLVGVSRCVQLLSPLGAYEFDVGTPDLPYLSHAKFFVTEWLEDGIDEYFLRQDKAKAIEKLKVFNEVVLSLEALHVRSISHRDIKTDNFRKRKGDNNTVVVIDLGTAVERASPALKKAYSDPVGLLAYSAPEAFCGLAGDRQVAPLTDIYGLGCMLFELFAEDDFWTAYNRLNPDYESRLGVLRHVLARASTIEEILSGWEVHAPKLLAGLASIEFPRDGASVPLAVVDIVNDLVVQMTRPDFRFRNISLAQVRRRLWSAIHCLENDFVARMRAERVAARRRAKRERAIRRGGNAL
jgi:serine/threonine protein kinase